jgi:hypothetical protein
VERGPVRLHLGILGVVQVSDLLGLGYRLIVRDEEGEGKAFRTPCRIDGVDTDIDTMVITRLRLRYPLMYR